jgi:hypothetical protein
MSLVLFTFFCLNFGHVCCIPYVLGDRAAIIGMSPSPEAIHNDLQRSFSFNNSRFVARWRCDAARESLLVASLGGRLNLI